MRARFWLGLLLPLFLAPAPADAVVEIEGSWHVLVHYKDSGVPNADAERWEDRFWVFTPKGDRLEWADYPIVVFDDPTGRFEGTGNRLARARHYWEPNEGQLQELHEGRVRVNDRGSTRKKMSGSHASGWSTRNRSMVVSASVISYSVNLSVEGLDREPIFTKVDAMGSMRTEGMEGMTRFTTEVVELGGNVLRGRYVRDGTRVGSFRMLRTGHQGLERKSQEERTQQAFQEAIDRGVVEVMGFSINVDEIRAELLEQLRRGEDVPDEVRDEVRKQIRQTVEDGYRSRGVNPRDVRSEVASITNKVLALVEQGKTQEEIQQMFREGKIRP